MQVAQRFITKFKLVICAVVFNTLLSATALATTEAQIQRIDDYLDQSALTGFSGAVLIAKGDKVLLNKGYGLADRELNRANTATTIFDIGSVTKQFTATAILKLASQNKLSVTDPISRYFKHLPDDKKNITLHQLLTHTSGIGRVGKGDFDHIPTEVYFDALFETSLNFEPGAKYRYSNAGYSILARVVELASGMTYESYVHEHLFEPAGMDETGYLIPEWDATRLAKGYRYSAFNTGSTTTRYQNDDEISWVLKGNGGFNSTLGDMYKWYKAISSNKVLTPSYTEKLITPYVKEDPEGYSHYAYGWAIFSSSRDTKVVAHNGSNGTFFYDFIWLPEEEVLITYASNALVVDAMRLGGRLEKMLFNEQYTPTPFSLDTTSKVVLMALAHQGNGASLIEKIKHELGDAITSKRLLNRAGLALLAEKHVAKSVALFELNLQLYPDDGNLWDSLGEALLENQQFKESKVAFEKALALGASAERCYWCDNASRKLKAIQAVL